jgi:hypothetical protein
VSLPEEEVLLQRMVGDDYHGPEDTIVDGEHLDVGAEVRLANTNT